MKDFRKIYKQLASNKQATIEHVVQLAILKALDCSEGFAYLDPKAHLEILTDLANRYIKRSFTPITSKIKLDNGRLPYDTVERTLRIVKASSMVFGISRNVMFDTENEILLYHSLVTSLLSRYALPNDWYHRYYMYVFVRQDIAPEYQAVQACHAATKMGFSYLDYVSPKFPAKNLDGLYLTLVGVRDVEGLTNAIQDVNYVGAKVYHFYEPDIGNQLTAFATSPIRADKRMRLLSYKKLRF